jgi:predicted metal-dependent phosphotriesterase family hydrolase
MRMFMALLLKHGITENEIMLMAKVNPSKLLDLD